MKRHFLTGLKAFAVGALAFAAVSCYDDQPIWDEIEGLKDRVTALEEKLNTEVATINTTLGTLKAADEKLAADIAAVVADVKKVNETLTTLDAYDKTLDGKIADLNAALAAFEDEASKQLAAAIAQIAVVKAEKNEAGNYVLTFADGKTLEVAAADANANNTGVITTVEVDGVTYWAVIGADGKTKVLDAAVHPDTKLQFKVDPETNELLVTYDGKTWEQTDVIVNDDTTFNVVTDFEDGEDYVTITVGGEEYQLPKYVADNSSLVLGRTDMFVMYAGVKTVELEAEDIEEYYVMAKPDGWKAVIDGTTLTVTAPAEDVVEMGAGEVTGEVLVHATTLTGTCKVVKLDVKTGPGLTLSYKDGNISLFTALTETTLNPWFGDYETNFSQVQIGATPVEEFRAYPSFEEFIKDRPTDEGCKDGFGDLLLIASNSFDMETWYVAGEREEMTFDLPLDELAAGAWPPVELDTTKLYVVWALPSTSDGYLYEGAVYAATGNVVDYTASNSVYNNADITLDLFGADGYYVGAVNKTYLDEFFSEWEMPEDEVLEYYLLNGTMGGWGPPSGPFSKFLQGNANAMGKFYTPGQHTLKLADVIVSDSSIEPGNDFYVWVLPYYEGQPAAEYSVEDIFVNKCETAPMVKNDAIAATLAVLTVAKDSVVYTVTPPANGKTVFEILPFEDYEADFFVDVDGTPEFDEASLIKYLKWNEPIEKKDTINQTWFIEPDTDYILVAYSTVAGEYAISNLEFTTPAAVEYATPDNAQWMFKSASFDEVYGGGATPDYLFDLNVSMAEQYGDAMGFTACLAVDYEDIYGADAAGFWAAPVYSSHAVAPTDETSGVISFNGMEIPYSDFAETTCKFDFSEFFMEDAGTVVVEATLVETPIVVSPQ